MAAGSFAKVTGTGLALPTTSFATADWGNVTTDADNILTETSGGVYRPDEEGFYLIIAEGEHESTHNNRQNIRSRSNATTPTTRGRGTTDTPATTRTIICGCGRS